MTTQLSELAEFGWNAFFSASLDDGETSNVVAARVMAVHRDRLHVIGPGIDRLIRPFAEDAADETTAATVGDWLLLDRETWRPRRLLPRRSVFKRRAAGTGRQLQLIAANVDTLFIVSSCNHDFNIARLERYLALARDADVMPVIVLTKVDLAGTPEDFVRAASKLQPGLLVEVVDARDPDSTAGLRSWCGPGQTLAVAGSSGVGKSTLVNTLTGNAGIATQGIREDDAKGRHTTTGRALHRLPDGGWLLDTPGMRELQLADVSSGLNDVFGDIVALAGNCRFSDCGHETEPGCAVQAAITAQAIDGGRVARWRKLLVEEARNSATLAERRARDRASGKLARRIMSEKRTRRR